MNTKCIQKYLTLHLVAILNLTTISLFAQPHGFGLRAGLCFSNVKVFNHDADDILKTRTKPGLLVGVYYNATNSDHIIIRPGLDLAFKGYYDQFYRSPMPLNYIDFSLDLLYKIKSGHGHFVIGMAPVAGININNHYRSTSPKTDIGITGMAGYELAIDFSFQISYTYGFTKISTGETGGDKLSNRSIGLTVGYTF